MADSEVRVVYGFCQDNCKYPVYTKEEVVGLLEYVIANNALPPDLLIDGEINNSTQIASVNAIVEQNKGQALRIWVGTQAEYNAYTGDKSKLFAIITDDATKQYILDTLSQHTNAINQNSEAINNIISGTVVVGNAVNSEIATNSTKVQNVDLSENSQAQFGDYIVEKKEILWSGNTSVTGSNKSYFNLSKTLQLGDLIRVKYNYNPTKGVRYAYYQIVDDNVNWMRIQDELYNSGTAGYVEYFVCECGDLKSGNSQIYISAVKQGTTLSNPVNSTITLYEVARIIQ